MQLPETPFLSIADVAKRLATTEEKIEQYLKSRQLYASIDIKPSLLESCDGLCDHEVLLGGYFELSGYQNIYWDENGTYDLQAGHLLLPPKEPEDDKERRGTAVFLRKLAGDPLQYKDEWIKTGKPRSLRYMWRLGAYGHKVYCPARPLVINRCDIFIEMAELKAFEEEQSHTQAKNDLPISVMKKAGAKGGARPGRDVAIETAIKEFFAEDEKLLNFTIDNIASKFAKKYPDKSRKKVAINAVDYEVYCSDGKVFSCQGERYDGQKNKKINKSITLKTFKQNYISPIKNQQKLKKN